MRRDQPLPPHRRPRRPSRFWADRSGARLFRLALVSLAIFAAAAPWIATTAISVLGVDATTPIDWVPASYPARRAYAQFTADFESGDVVVASWPGCTLDAPSVARFLEAATGPGSPRDAAGRPWFEDVASGQQAVARLTAPPLGLDRATAVARLRGVLVGPDSDQTCVVVGFTAAGRDDRRRAVAWLRDMAHDTAGVPPADLHLAGPVVDDVAVDAASDESLRFYGPPAAAIVFALTWLALKSFRYAVVVFVLSLGCVGLAFASVGLWGDRMNPVLIVMPLLVLTLGVAGGIHLVNYLVEEYRRGQGRGAALRAVKTAWLPCTLSAGTTALGLVSLVVSELEPIRVFGFHAAIGVLATLVVMFLVLPGIFARWPIRRRVDGPHLPPALPWADWVTKRAGPIVATALAGLALAAAGVGGIRTSVGIDTLFAPGSRMIADYTWLEREIGPLVPIEVLVRFADSSEIRAAERLDIVREVGAALADLAPVAGVTSAALFLPELPDASAAVTVARKVVIARRLEAQLSQLSDMRLIRDVDGAQLWRVTARTSALTGLDYETLLGEVRRTVEPVIAAHGGADRGLAAISTGVMPLVNAIQNTLLRDLFTSFLSACLVISLVMMAVEGGVVTGLIAMIPNIFPMVLLFGLLGWTRAKLDIGSVMTASVALGMAVDGTFHFLTFFRRGLAASAGPASPYGRAAAVQAAFRHSAPALLQSALVCGLGILAFTASPFAPTRRFAWMLSLLVAAALVGDLVVLPALLTTRAGRWFRPARV
jgi:predicted RND superfamily exporter protein